MNNAVKKRSIVFLISDFMDEGYERIMRTVGKKHDLIGILLKDKREMEIPSLGILKLADAETGKQRWVDTSDPKFKKD